MTKTAVITGGAQGIGRGTAEYLLDRDWHVALLDTDGKALEEVAGTDLGDRLLCLQGDASKEKDVKDAFEAIAEWNEHPLSLLVNNAGISDPYSGPIEELELQDWQKWIDASLTSAFLCTRTAVPALRKAKGAIVNIGSTRASMSEPECEAYAAAKGGIAALTHALAISLGPDIRVNCIQPGWIETGQWQKSSDKEAPEHRDIDHEQHPVGRIGKVGDIAAAIAYLANEESSFVTGQTLNVDGGMTRKMIYEH